MKNKILLLLLGISLLNCNKSPKAENPPLAPTEIVSDGMIANEQPTATNSLDYLGTYKGTMPCADCPGIETSLELSEDFTFVLTRKYVGKATKATETKGTYSWNHSENAIMLDNLKNQPNQYLVDDGSLIQLDMVGKKLEGKLSSQYILKKIPEAEAAKLDAASPKMQSAQEIIGIHWKLTELNGKAVKGEDEKDLYIEFLPENNFKAYAGCNKLSGHYEYKDNRIHFMRIVGTMKACPNMDPEMQFREVLETVNNFVRNEKVLQFRKGEDFLAKFVAVPMAK
jgi:copper homeostasis protein (lipoprotein)